MTELDVVTGAFSYTGRAIAEELLARGRRVRSLSRTPAPAGSEIESAPFAFDESLADGLRGATTLYNTYWIRFEYGGSTFARAIANTRFLFRAAAEAGVRRIVHVSVANADRSELPYFRGKAETERALRECGLPHAIVRPTLVFGADDILINNIAWILRRFPLFVVPGDGNYEVQPVSVSDVARICTETESGTVDAAGPERFGFGRLVALVHRAVGARARIVHAPVSPVLVLVRLAGLLLRDVVLEPEELAGLRENLLVSDAPPLGRDSFTSWLEEHGHALGRKYTSELARNYRPYAPL